MERAMMVAVRTRADAEANRPEAHARALLARAGVHAPVSSITPVAGGRNNRIYRLCAGGGAFAMKCYHRDPADPRDRFAAETAFLGIVGDRVAGDMPQLLASDDERGVALLEWIDGTSVGQVAPAHLDAALRFIERINGPVIRRAAKGRLGPASQTASTIAGHAAGLRRRVQGLRTRAQSPPRWRDATDDALGRLEVRLALTLAGIAARDLGPDHACADAELTAAERILSPSDFGFHNAIERGASIAFIDFEYAGWDDPAKLVCDFFLQPRVLAPSTYLAAFTAGVAGACRLDTDWLARRVGLLMPICRLLWACIALNVLDPVHMARRLAATGPCDLDTLLGAQLALAGSYMHETGRT
jgi:hypothetical protein